MVTETFTILNASGLHARPAATLVRQAAQFQSTITLIKDGFRVNGKSIMGVMMLAAEQGSVIRVEVSGDDEDDALAGIGELITQQFGESEEQ